MNKYIIFLIFHFTTSLTFAQSRQSRTFPIGAIRAEADLTSWQSSVAMVTSWLTAEPFDKSQFLSNSGIWSRFPNPIAALNPLDSNKIELTLGLTRERVDFSELSFYTLLTSGPVIISNLVQNRFYVLKGISYPRSRTSPPSYQVANPVDGSIKELNSSEFATLVTDNGNISEPSVVAYHFSSGNIIRELILRRKIGVSFYTLNFNGPETNTFHAAAAFFARYYGGIKFGGNRVLVTPISSGNNIAMGFHNENEIIDSLLKIKRKLRAISPSKKIDFFNISTHGLPQYINLGTPVGGANRTIGVDHLNTRTGNSSLKNFAIVLDSILSDTAKLVFFACCTSAGDPCCNRAASEESESRRCKASQGYRPYVNDNNGIGSFCDSLEMYLNPTSQPNKKREVWGHFTPGTSHTALTWRKFKQGDVNGINILGANEVEVSRNFGSIKNAVNATLGITATERLRVLSDFIIANAPRASVAAPFYENGQPKQAVVQWYINEWHITQ